MTRVKTAWWNINRFTVRVRALQGSIPQSFPFSHANRWPHERGKRTGPSVHAVCGWHWETLAYLWKTTWALDFFYGTLLKVEYLFHPHMTVWLRSELESPPELQKWRPQFYSPAASLGRYWLQVGCLSNH